MAGSSFGTLFRISTFGESHGTALGVIVDGCPAGLPLSEADVQVMMDRRRPSGGPLSTARKESDTIEILSGVFEGLTTGAPIAMMLRNENQRSSDYDALKDVFRPGHADFGFQTKFGIRDHRGGGRSSARETAARVAGGAIAKQLLLHLGISCHAEVTEIGGIPFSDREAVDALLSDARAQGDSVGSTVVCTASGVPAGLGDPVFEKLDARLAAAIFSIGAVKGLDIGEGRDAALMRGSDNNDAFRADPDQPGHIVTETNHAGGILGGISTGEDLHLTVYFKPTPSIAREQKTVTREGEDTTIAIRGRHDPVIGPRAAVVVESMTALVLADALLMNMGARMDNLEKIYGQNR